MAEAASDAYNFISISQLFIRLPGLRKTNSRQQTCKMPLKSGNECLLKYTKRMKFDLVMRFKKWMSRLFPEMNNPPAGNAGRHVSGSPVGRNSARAARQRNVSIR
ncbi:hypothetical protein, partial [Burkholderia cenocepacia]|uniref:hypothetical protein n=1 Tax=Burkholderia cenocepacia TaxID=95486 RepID=UPI00403F0678